MREINEHKHPAQNEAISIMADDRDVNQGGASHSYALAYRLGSQAAGESEADVVLVVDFQHGPLAEVGVNGITNEAMLAVLVDRMDGFQSGDRGSDEGDNALRCLREALAWLHLRTTNRIARHVEGTSTR